MLRLLGIMLMLYSLTFLPPVGVSLFYADGQAVVFLDGILLVLLTGLLCWLPAMRHRVLLNFEGEAEGVSTDDVLRAILEATPTASEVVA